MIKFQIVFVSILLSSISFGQFFPEGNNDSFKKMLTEGVHYAKTGDVIVDQAFIDALKSSWTVSKFEIIESTQVQNDMVMIGNYSITLSDEVTLENHDFHSIAISIHKEVDEPTDDNIVGRLNYNGFIGMNSTIDDRVNLIELMVKVINKGAIIVKENELFKKKKIDFEGVSFFDVLSETIEGKSGLRLIIPENTTETAFYKHEKMTKAGINFKVVGKEELQKILNEKNENDCILSWGEFGVSGTSNSILNIKTGDLVLSELKKEMEMKPYFNSPHKIYKYSKVLFSNN